MQTVKPHIEKSSRSSSTHTPVHCCCIPCFICSLLFITLHFTPQGLEQIKGCLLLYAHAYSTPKSLYGIWLYCSQGAMWNWTSGNTDLISWSKFIILNNKLNFVSFVRLYIIFFERQLFIQWFANVKVYVEIWMVWWMRVTMHDSGAVGDTEVSSRSRVSVVSVSGTHIRNPRLSKGKCYWREWPTIPASPNTCCWEPGRMGSRVTEQNLIWPAHWTSGIEARQEQERGQLNAHHRGR